MFVLFMLGSLPGRVRRSGRFFGAPPRALQRLPMDGALWAPNVVRRFVKSMNFAGAAIARSCE
jgi:hypothetical protein